MINVGLSKLSTLSRKLVNKTSDHTQAPVQERMCAYKSYRSSRLAPGPTVTKLGQIPHPGAQALRLVMANFDRPLFESQKICLLKLTAPAAMPV